MHVLQSKHTKLDEEESKKILEKYNISISQLPKIKLEDPALPEGCKKGDVVKINKKAGEKTVPYYRVIV